MRMERIGVRSILMHEGLLESLGQYFLVSFWFDLITGLKNCLDVKKKTIKACIYQKAIASAL